jgi:outer membrane protein assembly factor BamB
VTPCDQNIVTPLQAGDVVVASSLDRGTMGIRLDLEGGKWAPRVAWHTREVSLYMSSPVLAQGRVVGLSHLKRGQYFALDPSTGTVHWKSDPAQGENAALVRAGDSLLVLQGDGSLLVLPADGASFRPLRRYAVADTATYAHPIPTELGILVKDESGLALYGLAAASGSGR